MTDGSLGDDLTAIQRTTWIRFAIVAHGIPAELNSRLLSDSGIGQFEFLVLNHLKLSEERSMPMTRLAVLMASSLSRLSHVVSRLESDGRVIRSRSAEDRRVAIATLTDHGLELFQKAAPGYVADVIELFFDRLTGAELSTLDTILGKLLPGVDGGGILAPLAQEVGSRTIDQVRATN